MNTSWTGMLPATRTQVEQLTQLVKGVLMAKIDDVLHHVANKLDAAADRIGEELKRLEAELQRGRPSPESIARVRASVERLHKIVPETAEEDDVPYEPEPEGEHEGEEAEEAEEHG